MSVTVQLRTLLGFAAGLAVALIAVFVFQAWQVDAAPGDTDTTFVPITPCRLIDTRPAPDRVGSHASFGLNDTKTIAAHGSNGNCTIPGDAVGLSLNVTAIGATAATFLTIWPDGAMPQASSLNPFPGEPATPNAVTTNLSGAGAFNIFNLAGTVDVIVDVNGYHTKRSLQALAADIAELRAAQPFAVTDHNAVELIESFDDEVIVAVTVTAPVAGQVTVNSTTNAFEDTATHSVHCSITTGTTLVGAYTQAWTSPGGAGHSAQLAGTRMFDIAARATTTYNLVCRCLGTDSIVQGSVLTAVFTPAP